MTEYKALVYGIYPRSEVLRKNINLWERSRLPREELVARIEEEKARINGMLNSKGIVFTDPLSNWHDILRPLALSMEGISLGELRRYKETNTFYRQPVIENYPKYSAPDEDGGFPYFPPYSDTQGSSSAFVPGPYSFLHMSSISGELEGGKLLSALAESFSEFLNAYGFRKVVIYDPVQYFNAGLDHLSPFTEKFETILVTSGSLNGTDMGSVADKLAGISARGGLESLRGYSGEIYLQHVDSQNTRLENPDDLVRLLDREKRNTKLNIAGITHSEYLDFLPRSIADRKVEVMKEVVAHE